MSLIQSPPELGGSRNNKSNKLGRNALNGLKESVAGPVFAGFIASAVLAVNSGSSVLYWLTFAAVVLIGVLANRSALFLYNLAIWAYFPISYFSAESIQSYLNPSSILLVLLLVRSKARLTGMSIYILSIALVYFAASSIFSINQPRSLAWAFQFVLLAYIAASSGSFTKHINSRYVHTGFAIICISLAILAIVEFVISTPLIYNGRILPEYLEAWKWQYYAVYRITTTLGHPLNNGLFFAFAALVFIRQAVIGEYRLLSSIVAGLSSLGVIISGSRSAILSISIGALVLVLFETKRINVSARLWLVLLAPLASVLVLQNSLVQKVFSRFSSSESESSQNYRQDLLQWVDYFNQKFFLSGTGPGTSGIEWLSYGSTSPLENGFLQLWVSNGLIATLIILAIGIIWLIVKFRSSAAVIFLPIILYIPLTNFIDSSYSFMALICIAVVVGSLNGQDRGAALE